MTNCSAKSKIACDIRCLDPAVVANAARRLDPKGVERVSYTCQLSGEKEVLLLVGDDFASRLVESLPDVDDIGCAKILAGLHSAELCECDVATLTGLPEDEVISQLSRLVKRGVVAHRKVRDMNYFRLGSDHLRQKINDAVRGSV